VALSIKGLFVTLRNSIKGLFVTRSLNDTQQNNIVLIMTVTFYLLSCWMLLFWVSVSCVWWCPIKRHYT